jgi:hypothetical protein
VLSCGVNINEQTDTRIHAWKEIPTGTRCLLSVAKLLSRLILYGVGFIKFEFHLCVKNAKNAKILPSLVI